MGKSTVIQSLLVLKQSEQNNYLPKSICLNGIYVNAGMAQDVLYEYAENDLIELQLQERERSFITKVHYKKDADVLEADSSGNYQNISLFNEHFEYLNAERKAPQVIYPKSSYHIDSQAQLGVNGEYTVHFLCRYQDKSIAWDKDRSLKEAVQFWLDMISPEVKFDVSEIENTDLAKLGFYYTENGAASVSIPVHRLNTAGPYISLPMTIQGYLTYRQGTLKHGKRNMTEGLPWNAPTSARKRTIN